MERTLALALYTVREAFAIDSRETLRAVRRVGYGAVEFAGLGRWKAGDVRAQLDELGLRGLSAHVPLARLRDDLPGVILEARTLGLEYVVFPWLPPDQRDAAFFRSLVPVLTAAGEACRDAGLGFCYHNHDFEFRSVLDGVNALEFLAAQVAPELLSFELDVYWAAFAGLDPVRVLERFGERVPLVHLKDMSSDAERGFAEVGSGTLDFPAILEAAEGSGARWCVVEQDECRRPPLESAALSFEYLRTLGLGA